ncbi:oxytocin receptor-like [Ruditapes philippinarum]|uniref:oxytocin receptor-like n=1 Tax=Ruditapes philippinarum TaxID=129788 RepID=UPI00295B8F0B|nr:oxytocin receptor-like [Ruditapes philippinarum]
MKWSSRFNLSQKDTTGSSDKLPGERSEIKGRISKAKIKSIKMTLVVCLAFFICWTPYFLVMLISIYHPGTIETKAYLILGCLYPLNSACNPIIFIMFNRKHFTCQQKNQQVVQSSEGASTSDVNVTRCIPLDDYPDPSKNKI